MPTSGPTSRPSGGLVYPSGSQSIRHADLCQLGGLGNEVGDRTPAHLTVPCPHDSYALPSLLLRRSTGLAAEPRGEGWSSAVVVQIQGSGNRQTWFDSSPPPFSHRKVTRPPSASVSTLVKRD